MALQELLVLAETLGRRIDEFEAVLKRSEALTRYVLIDPLLRALGWDTEDPELVIPEYNNPSGKADYALFHDGKPLMMVEAKKLGISATERQDATRQCLSYCMDKGTLYFAVSDGQQWEIYETHKPVALAEKRVAIFDLKEHPVQASLQALSLWRPNVVDRSFQTGRRPVIFPPTDTEWELLKNCSPKKGTRAPREIKFPDGKTRANAHWYDLLGNTVKWLWENERLREETALPRFLTLSDGQQFRLPKKAEGTPFTYEGNGGINIVEVVVKLLDDLGEKPAQVQVRTSSK